MFPLVGYSTGHSSLHAWRHAFGTAVKFDSRLLLTKHRTQSEGDRNVEAPMSVRDLSAQIPRANAQVPTSISHEARPEKLTAEDWSFQCFSRCICMIETTSCGIGYVLYTQELKPRIWSRRTHDPSRPHRHIDIQVQLPPARSP